MEILTLGSSSSPRLGGGRALCGSLGATSARVDGRRPASGLGGGGHRVSYDDRPDYAAAILARAPVASSLAPRRVRDSPRGTCTTRAHWVGSARPGASTCAPIPSSSRWRCDSPSCSARRSTTSSARSSGSDGAGPLVARRGGAAPRRPGGRLSHRLDATRHPHPRAGSPAPDRPAGAGPDRPDGHGRRLARAARSRARVVRGAHDAAPPADRGRRPRPAAGRSCRGALVAALIGPARPRSALAPRDRSVARGLSPYAVAWMHAVASALHVPAAYDAALATSYSTTPSISSSRQRRALCGRSRSGAPLGGPRRRLPRHLVLSAFQAPPSSSPRRAPRRSTRMAPSTTRRSAACYVGRRGAVEHAAVPCSSTASSPREHGAGVVP